MSVEVVPGVTTTSEAELVHRAGDRRDRRDVLRTGIVVKLPALADLPKKEGLLVQSCTVLDTIFQARTGL